MPSLNKFVLYLSFFIAFAFKFTTEVRCREYCVLDAVRAGKSNGKCMHNGKGDNTCFGSTFGGDQTLHKKDNCYQGTSFCPVEKIDLRSNIMAFKAPDVDSISAAITDGYTMIIASLGDITTYNKDNPLNEADEYFFMIDETVQSRKCKKLADAYKVYHPDKIVDKNPLIGGFHLKFESGNIEVLSKCIARLRKNVVQFRMIAVTVAAQEMEVFVELKKIFGIDYIILSEPGNLVDAEDILYEAIFSDETDTREPPIVLVNAVYVDSDEDLFLVKGFVADDLSSDWEGWMAGSGDLGGLI